MSEWWIWNNVEGAWWNKHGTGFTRLLHDAGRFAKPIAEERVRASNTHDSDTDYPVEVRVKVNNRFLPREAQRVLAEYQETGDREVIDRAYFRARDWKLLADPELQESIAQMLRGEGREIPANEFGAGEGPPEKSRDE